MSGYSVELKRLRERFEEVSKELPGEAKEIEAARNSLTELRNALELPVTRDVEAELELSDLVKKVSDKIQELEKQASLLRDKKLGRVELPQTLTAKERDRARLHSILESSAFKEALKGKSETERLGITLERILERLPEVDKDPHRFLEGQFELILNEYGERWSKEDHPYLKLQTGRYRGNLFPEELKQRFQLARVGYKQEAPAPASKEEIEAFMSWAEEHPREGMMLVEGAVLSVAQLKDIELSERFGKMLRKLVKLKEVSLPTEADLLRFQRLSDSYNFLNPDFTRIEVEPRGELRGNPAFLDHLGYLSKQGSRVAIERAKRSCMFDPEYRKAVEMNLVKELSHPEQPPVPEEKRTAVRKVYDSVRTTFLPASFGEFGARLGLGIFALGSMGGLIGGGIALTILVPGIGAVIGGPMIMAGSSLAYPWVIADKYLRAAFQEKIAPEALLIEKKSRFEDAYVSRLASRGILPKTEDVRLKKSEKEESEKLFKVMKASYKEHVPLAPQSFDEEISAFRLVIDRYSSELSSNPGKAAAYRLAHEYMQGRLAQLIDGFPEEFWKKDYSEYSNPESEYAGRVKERLGLLKR